ncbi:MAG: EAL domain-containing protein [Propionivibrio sp.]
MFSVLVRLIGRLSVGRKLILIYALDLTAVIFVSGILINEKFIAIDFARKEIVGNQYISVVRETLFSASGERPAGDQAPPIDGNTLRDAERRFGAGMDSAELAVRFAQHLDRPGKANWPQTIQAGRALIIRIGNQSNLILDPDLDSYYTMSLILMRFPELFELVEHIRAKTAEKAATALERGRLQTTYLILEGQLDAIVKGIDTDYAEAISAARPDTKKELSAARATLLLAINRYRDDAHEAIFNESSGVASPNIDAAASALLGELDRTWAGAGKTLHRLLETRLDQLFERMWVHLGTAAGLLLLILSVVFFVARQIALPVRRLADVADRVRATGDYELRARWGSGDELGRLVKGFNGMLEQLNQSRLIEQEMAANERAALAQRELLEAIPIPLVVTAIPRHEVLHSNVPAQRWLEDRSIDPWLSGLSAQARARFFQQLADQGVANEFEVLWQGAESRNWALLSARRLFYQAQDAVLTTFTPINSLKAMEERLALWAKVFEASSESIMITDGERRIVTVNRAFSRSTGYSFEEVAGQTPALLRSDRQPDAHFEKIWSTAVVRGSWQGELWLRRNTGESFPLWAVINAVRSDSDQITHFIVVAHDISERKANEQRISHLAQHDVLTDLPNRSLCVERLRLALQLAERQVRRVGVLFIDLDRFKNINDSLGHHIGDSLLRSVSRSLLSAVRVGDTVSRFGGDEFVVILNGAADADEILQIVNQRLIPLIRQPHEIEGVELHISCSVGIAVYPEHGTDIETLMRNADAAMYQAKFSGRNNAQFFSIEMDSRARERLDIENDLRHAVERGELRLFYQPRVACRSNRLLGAEALVRWQHPRLGLVPPGRFIAVAEESGLIVPVGAWIIDEACRQQAEWRDRGLGDIPVSVNLSAVQLRDPSLLSKLETTLKARRTQPRMIELELTESLLMENVHSNIALFHALKSLDVLLSIDDFGTGYSSLSYLNRFPIDKLKIDQSFVRDMLDDTNDLAITRAIIGLGHTLGLKVVAEGVEHIEEKQMLAAAGCDELQGYLFSRPLPEDEFVRWIKANAALAGD